MTTQMATTEGWIYIHSRLMVNKTILLITTLVCLNGHVLLCDEGHIFC